MTEAKIDNSNLPNNQILCGNCIGIVKTFPRESIDMVMFSSPYWWARDFGETAVSWYGGKSDCTHILPSEVDRRNGGAYCSKCNAWRGQMGLETTLAQHVENVKVLCETIKPVLKSSGSLFLNIGDTYGTHSGCNPRDSLGRSAMTAEKIGLTMKKRFEKPSPNFVLEKNLMLVPFRVAATLQDAGWILRNDIIWQKTSVLHTGAKDRLTNTYEHIFWFVKSQKYYCSKPDGNLSDVWLINSKPIVGSVGGYPEELYAIPIEMCCPPNGVVLDPMCGTGTTCVMAKRLKRKFIGIDINSDLTHKAEWRLLGVCPECGANTFVAKHKGLVVCLSCKYEGKISPNFFAVIAN